MRADYEREREIRPVPATPRCNDQISIRTYVAETINDRFEPIDTALRCIWPENHSQPCAYSRERVAPAILRAEDAERLAHHRYLEAKP